MGNKLALRAWRELMLHAFSRARGHDLRAPNANISLPREPGPDDRPVTRQGATSLRRPGDSRPHSPI